MSTDANEGVVRNINAGRNINEGVPQTSRKLSLLKSHQTILVVLVVVAAGTGAGTDCPHTSKRRTSGVSATSSWRRTSTRRHDVACCSRSTPGWPRTT